MLVGIDYPSAMQADGCVAAELERRRVEARMLAGENQARRQSVRGERLRNRSELDGFGSGADDQPDLRGMQSSP